MANPEDRPSSGTVASGASAAEPAPATAEVLPAGAHTAAMRIVIRRSRAEVYAYWRDFSHLPRFVEGIQQVREIDALSSIWTIRDAEGTLAEWEVIVTDDERGRLIAWSTSGRTPVRLAARAEFEDVEGGATRVTLVLESSAPATGVLEQLLSRESARVPRVLTAADLERLKCLLEAGEPVRVPGSSAAAERATEQGIGIIAPEPPGPGPVGGDLQSIRAEDRWARGATR